MTTWGSGHEIAGRYRLLELLGIGGMGEVWRAEHLTLHAQVAVKLIEPRSASNEAVIRRFMQEARAAAALQSPHVVRTTDFGVVDGTPYIVMELLTGESLAQRLVREIRLMPAATARVIRHVARAIGKAHQAGIVHRDLKPDNIFIVSNDDEELIKVLDFGIAKAIGGTFGENAAQTRTGALLGTPHYMSPEQAQGDRKVDFRSDLWSMGIIAFECLTGTRPFDSEGLGALVMQICAGPIPRPSDVGRVPPGFDEWFARAVCRDPDGRFQSARELSSALSAVLVPWELAEPTGTQPVPWPLPAGLGQEQRPVTGVQALTPMPALSPNVGTNEAYPPGPAIPTVGGTASGQVAPPTKGLLGALVVLALAGIVGLMATGLVLHAVTKRGSAESAPQLGAPAAASSEAVVAESPASVAPSEPPPPEAVSAPTPSASASAPPPPKPAVTVQRNTRRTTSNGKGRLGF